MTRIKSRKLLMNVQSDGKCVESGENSSEQQLSVSANKD